MYRSSLHNSLNSSLGSSPVLSPVTGPMACSCEWPTMLGYGGMRGNDAGCVIKLFKMMPKDENKYSLDVIGTYSGYDGQDAWNKLRSAAPALCPLGPVTTNRTIVSSGGCLEGTVNITSGTLNIRKSPAPDAGTGPGTGKNSQWGGKGSPPPLAQWPLARTARKGDKLKITVVVNKGESSDVLYYGLHDGTWVSPEFVTVSGERKPCPENPSSSRKSPEQQLPHYGLLIAYPGRQQVNVIFPLDEIPAYRPRGATALQFPQTRPLYAAAADCNISGKFRSSKSGKGNGGIGSNPAARIAVWATSMARESTPNTTAAQEAQGFTILNAALGTAATEALAACASGLPNTNDLGSLVNGVVEAYDALTDGGTPTPGGAPADAGGGYADAGGGYSDASAPSSGGSSTGLILGAVGAVAALYFITKG